MAASSPLLALATTVREKKTGQLKFQTEKVIRTIGFVEGACVFATSNAKSELPGTFLSKEKKMNPSQYENYLKALATSKGDPWLLAAQQAGLAAADLSTLVSAYAQKLIATLSSLLAECTFQEGSPPFAHGSTPGVRLLMAGAASIQPEKIAAVCPNLIASSSIVVPASIEKQLPTLPLDPEERGLLTVVKSNPIVGEVFTGSFLKPERIWSLLLAYTLAGFVEVESEASAKRKVFEASLSKEDRVVQADIRRRVEQLNSTSYYDWLEAVRSDSIETIRANTERLLERFSRPGLEKIFFGEEVSYPATLLKSIEDAFRILLGPATRADYDRFLSGGGTGPMNEKGSTEKESDSLSKAKSQASSGDMKAALATLAQGLAELPESTALIAEHARIALSAGGPKDPALRDMVLRNLQRGMKIDPPSPEIFEQLGMWLVILGQKQKAVEAFTRALMLSPRRDSAREGLEALDPVAAARATIDAMLRHLPMLTLYDLLGVSTDCNLAAIQVAYRECTRRYHPDRFFQSEDAGLKDRAKEIYKRMVEAYMTLKNPAKRKAYDATLRS